MFERTKELIQTIMDRDPAAKSKWEVVFAYPGFHAVMIHRFSSWCCKAGVRLDVSSLTSVAS